MIFKPYFGDHEIANLFRIGGPGLGNLLFPLSRAYIYSLQYNAQLLPPIWPSIKIGTFLRGEKEKRGYTNIFKSIFLKRSLKQIQYLFDTTISEDEFLNDKTFYSSKDKIIVQVEGLKNYFKDLYGYQEQLLNYLITISSSNIIDLYQSFNSQNIGVHIRLGDYNQEGRTPMNWYINVIKKIKTHYLYKDANFIIFSDGNNEELKDILDLPHCKRISTPNAWADILRLSKCQIIIGSNSTFSAWATFLGAKPFIRHDKFYLKKIHHKQSNIFEGSSIEDFLNIQESLSS